MAFGLYLVILQRYKQFLIITVILRVQAVSDHFGHNLVTIRLHEFFIFFHLHIDDEISSIVTKYLFSIFPSSLSSHGGNTRILIVEGGYLPSTI